MILLTQSGFNAAKMPTIYFINAGVFLRWKGESSAEGGLEEEHTKQTHQVEEGADSIRILNTQL